jgi:hypothetical protein
MSIIGQRKAHPGALIPSGVLLAKGARFNADIHELTDDQGSLPKGAHRFRTHAEADQHWHDSLVDGLPRWRPANLDDLKLLARALDAQGAEYLLVGGFALFAYGYFRATSTIDLLVPDNPEAGERVKAALMALPALAASPLDPGWFAECAHIRVADALVVDLLLYASNGESYKTLEKFGTTLEVEGVHVRTLDFEGLLRTKRTLRDKDRHDELVLELALDMAE